MGWRRQRFTFTQSFTAPAEILWISGCAGGGGGGGGDPTPGGGGGGGCAGQACSWHPFPCINGETLTLVIGAAGSGGAVGANGAGGGDTSISGSLGVFTLFAAWSGGTKASGTTGGSGSSWLPGSIINGGSGGANGVTGGSSSYGGVSTSTAYQLPFTSSLAKFSTGGGGGGLNASGGYGLTSQSGNTTNAMPGAGNSSGGGGGGGGGGPWGRGGNGGSNGGAGQNATGYGSGGGGGSGNSAGGNGTPGMLDIVWFEDAWSASNERTALGLASANLDAQFAGVLSGIGAIPTTPLLAANYTPPPSVSAIRTEMDANSAKLANLDAAISTRAATGSEMAITSDALADIQAQALAAIQSYDPPTGAEMYAGFSGIEDDIAAIPTSPLLANDYIAPDNTGISDILARIEEQVASGPVAVIPAPSTETSTTAWVYCYDTAGAPAAEVSIQIRMDSSGGSGSAYTGEIAEYVSNETGLVTAEIPRGAGLRFSARRGTMGKWIRFNGVDAETLSLPSLLGTP